MKIFTNNELKAVLGLTKLPPVYYLESHIVEACEKEVTGTLVDSDDVALSRPFDEVVLITEMKYDTPELTNVHQSLVVHFTSDGEYRNFNWCSASGYKPKWNNTTIREQFKNCTLEEGLLKLAGRDLSKDSETFSINQSHMVRSLLPFSHKSSVLSLESTLLREPRLRNPKKARAVAQNYILVTPKGTHQGASGTTVPESQRIAATLVCGHWRVFRKKPQSVGSDRHGNALIGKTWVAPYKRGEGEVILEKIRLWLK